MHKKIKFTKNMISTYDNYLEYDTESSCPICKASISPVYIASSLDSLNSASIYNYCENCHNTFLTKYQISCNNFEPYSHNTFEVLNKIYSEPNRFVKQKFDDKVIELSPQFEKIYNQALAAESSNLDEIAGLGYRKALEFLIKDYAIHKYPNESEAIKSKPMMQCIKSYISNDAILTLAEKSTWIGNDEAHYIRKQEDRDVSDMKAFIQAIVYFIGMILITEDAASMVPK